MVSILFPISFDTVAMAQVNGEPATPQSKARDRTESLLVAAAPTPNVNDDYVLTRDAAASARLNLSHYLWLASFGFNLHPRISDAVNGKVGLQVADIGTGTGCA